ncbi:hypothetical protein Vadar_019847 [Vaccinium darrowii]|uniref:Uncharacterized protein n=1 Tax=Vaccinium darrowii TaxID=229202 RepID=A0ACB7ZKJ7_9ERIC|nr:hypothetical protein Vadar_019847 [Vaccinium darrowii]
MLDVILPEALSLGSDDKTELLCATLEIFCSASRLTSVVRTWEGSESLPAMTGSRILETAGRLEDPLDHKKLELDNCTSQTKISKIQDNRTSMVQKLEKYEPVLLHSL